MNANLDKPVETQGATIFQLFALYVVASQTFDVVARLLPPLKRALPFADYESFLDTGYVLFIVLAVGVVLRFCRNAIVRSELAPLYTMLGFAIVLPYLSQLLADVAMEIANLLATGRLGPTRSDLIEHYLAVEPYRMISQIVLGAGAAGIWHLVVKLIFRSNARRLLRPETMSLRSIGLSFLLYAVALPAAIGLGVLVRDAIRIWLPPEYARFSYELSYALAVCAIAICLVALRGPLQRSDLSPAYIVLSFVLLMVSVHNLIDREILNVTRSVTNDQMPWEDSLPIRTTINYVANAAYHSVLNVIGALAAYGLIRLVFGQDLTVVVRRTTHAPAPGRAA
jgi:hypothetical protein